MSKKILIINGSPRANGNTELEKAFELPENEHSVLLMPVGYRVEGTAPFPTHEQKKSLDEIVKYL